jgi:replicative DNA helicase
MSDTTYPSEPPAAVEPEGAILGAVLQLDNSTAITALMDLNDDDFTVPAHLLVFQAASALLVRGEAPTPLAVLCELRTTGRVSSWPTPSASVGVFIAELYEQAPIPLGYGVAKKAVLEAAGRRRLHYAALRLGQAAGFGPFEGLTRLLAEEATAVLKLCTRLSTVTG